MVYTEVHTYMEELREEGRGVHLQKPSTMNTIKNVVTPIFWPPEHEMLRDPPLFVDNRHFKLHIYVYI